MANNEFRTFAVRRENGELLTRPSGGVMLYEEARAKILAGALSNTGERSPCKVVPVNVTVVPLTYADPDRVKIPGEPTEAGWFKCKYTQPSSLDWGRIKARWFVPDEVWVGGGYYISDEGRHRCWGEHISEWKSVENPNLRKQP